MINWSQQPEDRNNLPLWPWEEKIIDACEYERSLQSLQHFIMDIDLSILSTLEDLSAVASLVGHDLYIVTAVRGKQLEKSGEGLKSESGEPVSPIGHNYACTISLDDRQIMLGTGDGHSWISERHPIGWQHYQREVLKVKLPADRDIAIGNVPNVDRHSLYILDMRGTSRKEYYPVDNPANPEVQQGFASVLKEAVQDVVRLFT